ncbi:hypothetical protein [Stutzerimonas xanthomarina]|uniref:hypothetical protein n=1 Tax=Stutzerimonas xanthomarina TaxID=271420 RepID=UPI003AA7D577
MTDMMSATRSFETGVEVLNRARACSEPAAAGRVRWRTTLQGAVAARHTCRQAVNISDATRWRTTYQPDGRANQVSDPTAGRQHRIPQPVLGDVPGQSMETWHLAQNNLVRLTTQTHRRRPGRPAVSVASSRCQRAGRERRVRSNYASTRTAVLLTDSTARKPASARSRRKVPFVIDPLSTARGPIQREHRRKTVNSHRWRSPARFQRASAQGPVLQVQGVGSVLSQHSRIAQAGPGCWRLSPSSPVLFSFYISITHESTSP